MTISLLLKWFAPHVEAKYQAVEVQRGQLSILRQHLQVVTTQAQQTTIEITKTIAASAASQAERGRAQAEYIKKETDSGLRKGVSGDAKS